MNSKFDLYTIVEKTQFGFTFYETESLQEASEIVVNGGEHKCVRIYDKESNITHEELDNLNTLEEGTWFVSVISNQGTHIGYEYRNVKEVKEAISKLILVAWDNVEDSITIYPPSASVIDIENLKIKEKEKRAMQALDNFYQAAFALLIEGESLNSKGKLNDILNGGECGYPFEYSFDEVVSMIGEWETAVFEKMNKKENEK